MYNERRAFNAIERLTCRGCDDDDGINSIRETRRKAKGECNN